MSKPHVITLEMKPRRGIQGWVMRRWCSPGTISCTRHRLGRVLFVELVGYRWRRLHHWYAVACGYFWLPCPLCGREFGGHEWRCIDGKRPNIEHPSREGISRGICPQCTRAGKGTRW